MTLTELDGWNLDNLTGLWQKMAAKPGYYQDLGELQSCAAWPHRHWFDWRLELAGLNLNAGAALAQLPEASIVPVWGGVPASVEVLQPLLLAQGYQLGFSQTAMFLELDGYQMSAQPALQLVIAETAAQRADWTRIASAAFGYAIEQSVINNIADDADVQLLLAHEHGIALASALLFKTADVIGIHQLGVLPACQGRGIALALMQQIIQRCRQWQGRYLTLQASAAGLPLYQRLGFAPQFNIHNFQRLVG